MIDGRIIMGEINSEYKSTKVTILNNPVLLSVTSSGTVDIRKYNPFSDTTKYNFHPTDVNGKSNPNANTIELYENFIKNDSGKLLNG